MVQIDTKAVRVVEIRVGIGETSAGLNTEQGGVGAGAVSVSGLLA